MKKIWHAKSAELLKQSYRPICAIYAFLNGFYNERYRRKDWVKIAEELWEIAISKQKPESVLQNNQAGDFDTFSLIGEFFSSNVLAHFLNDKEVHSKMKQLGINDYSVKEQTFGYSKAIDKDSFYIIPINSDPKNNNMHWICLRYKDNKWQVCNSASIKTEKKALQQADGRLKGINNLKELRLVWSHMYMREHEYEKFHTCSQVFDFGKWHKCKKIQVILRQKRNKRIINRYNSIWNKNCGIRYNFKNSVFNVIRISKL